MNKPRIEMAHTDEELIKEWRQACVAVKEAKKLVEGCVELLARRAKVLRPDFKERFTEEPPHSRQVTIDGGNAGKVAVEFAAVFEVEENLGEKAKAALERWGRNTRARYSNDLGENKVRSVELVYEVLAQVGDRRQKAKLSKSSASGLSAIDLPKHTPKSLREGIEFVVKSLQPGKGKLSVKEVK